MSKAHHVIPLALSGNVTPQQTDRLRDAMTDAVNRGLRLALEKLDQHSAALVLELEPKLKSEITSAIEKVIQRFTISEKYMDEEAVSRREYPATYRPPPSRLRSPRFGISFPACTVAWRSSPAGPSQTAPKTGSPFRAGKSWPPPTARQSRKSSMCWRKSASSPIASSTGWERPFCGQPSAPRWQKRS
jgi:hypothetical protein